MPKGNQKIRNATICKSDGITFKSQLEKMTYNTLVEQGFNPTYEPVQITLWDGFIPITSYYDEESQTHYNRRKENGDNSPKMLVQKNSKIIGIRYTCDFYVRYNDIDVWIESKSIENDVFYIKKKMFIKYLDNKYLQTGQKSLYFEVHSKKQVLQMIDIIKNYEKSI